MGISGWDQQHLNTYCASVDFRSTFLSLLPRNISVVIIVVMYIPQTPVLVYKVDQFIIIYGSLIKLTKSLEIQRKNIRNRRGLHEKIKLVWTLNRFWRRRACSDVFFVASVNNLIGKQKFVCSDEFWQIRQNIFLSEFAFIVTVALGATNRAK